MPGLDGLRAIAVMAKRLIRHHWAEIRTADTDVDHMGDPVVAPHSIGKPAHLVDHVVDVGDDIHPVDGHHRPLRRPQRAVLGLRNPGHTLAKLLPAVPGALRVVNHTHPEYALSLSEFLGLTGATALLLRGTEGEPVADARRRPAFNCFVRGRLDDELSLEAQGGSLAELPALPAGFDAETTAHTVRAMLAGEQPVPTIQSPM